MVWEIKEPGCQCRRHKRHGFDSWVRKIPWRRKWQATPVFLPGKLHGQRSLEGWTAVHGVTKSWTRLSSESESVSCSVVSDSETVACQAPLSLRFSRQEYWSGLPFPSPGDLPDPETEPMSPALQADSLPSGPKGKPLLNVLLIVKLCSFWCYFRTVFLISLWFVHF